MGSLSLDKIGRRRMLVDSLKIQIFVAFHDN